MHNGREGRAGLNALLCVEPFDAKNLEKVPLDFNPAQKTYQRDDS